MAGIEIENIIEAYKAFITNKGFPCIAAKAALASGRIQCMVADSMACPKDDAAILQFLYRFVDSYRISENSFHSAAIIFKAPQLKTDEENFDDLLWQRLQSLTNLDGKNHRWDHRVSQDPRSSRFSFSIKEEAFFV